MSKKPAPTFQCQYCDKLTERRKCLYKDGRWGGAYDMGQKYCSKECGWKGRPWRPINPEGHRHSSGYIRLHFRGGAKKLKHRHVMEQQLGRELTGTESVHHKNGDKTDNRLENLELWTRYQPSGQRVSDKVAYAIEILIQYSEFSRQAGFVLTRVHQP